MSQESQNYWKRSRFNRRRFVQGAGVAGVGAAAFGLVGCGDDDDKPASTSTATSSGGTAGATTTATGSAVAQPKKGGELVLGLGAPTTQSLDPHKTVNLGFSYYGLFLNRIISPERQKISPLQGDLVESWEQPDKLTTTMKVRKGPAWHDGKPGGGRAVTAQDIAFNIMRIAGKTDPSRAALYQRATNLFGLDKAEAIDDSTVKISFTTPNSAFLSGLSDWRNWVCSPDTVEKDPDFKDIKNFVGTGPFIIDSWDSTTLTGKYVANPKYWKTGKPYLASVSQVSFADPAATESGFLSGKIDFESTMSDELRQHVIQRRSEAKIYNWENLQWDYFGFNQTKAQFGDARVRQAIFKAIDYSALMNQAAGKGFWDFSGLITSGLPGVPNATDVAKTSPWNPATKAQDLTDAKKLLESAGFPDGKGISFKILPSGSTGQYFDHSVRVQDQLQKAFPQIKIEITPPADGAAFASSLSRGDYELVAYTAAPPPDAVFDPAQRLRTGASRNYTKFSDPSFDALIDKIFAEYDATARKALFDQLLPKMADQILNIPIGKITQSVAAQSRIQGFAGFGGVGSFLYPYDPVNAAEQVWIA